MTRDELIDAWSQPFDSDDAAKGGCPHVQPERMAHSASCMEALVPYVSTAKYVACGACSRRTQGLGRTSYEGGDLAETRTCSEDSCTVVALGAGSWQIPSATRWRRHGCAQFV